MNLPERPALKGDIYTKIIDSVAVLLPAEGEPHFFDGPAYTRVIPLLDGNRTISQLRTALEGQTSILELVYVLQRLAAEGLLTDGAPKQGAEAETAWRNTFGLLTTPEAYVAVEGGSSADAEAIRSALGTLGGRRNEQEAALRVVLTDHYLNPQLQKLNRDMIRTPSEPWMLLRLCGYQSWIGPVFRSGASGCWACLAERIRLNHQIEAYIMRKQGGEQLPTTHKTGTANSRTFAIEWAVLEIERWLAGDPFLEQHMLSVDPVRFEVIKHAFTKRPQCPSCGDPEMLRRRARIRLERQPKRFVSDGGHRICSPYETFEAYRHHISDVTGVVTWMVDATEDEEDLAYHFVAGHNFAMGRDGVFWLGKSLRVRTGGKGQSRIQAQVSALGEAVERYSGMYRGDEPHVRARYVDLDEAGIHLYECLHFSAKQYGSRKHSNRDMHNTYQYVPNPFDEQIEIEWTPLWSLSKQKVRYLPSAYCYYGHPESEHYFFCGGDSNGCAAGNTLEEAVLQAFFELVERDAVAIWWYNKLLRPAAAIDSFERDAAYMDRLRRYYAERKRNFWVIDITSDLGIPCFAALSARTDQTVEDIIVGFGAHLDPRIAILRAVTELNQFLPAVGKRRSDGTTAYNWPEDEAIRWWKNERTEGNPWLVPDPSQTPMRQEDYPVVSSNDLFDDVEFCRQRVEKAGMEMLLLDQTRPDIGMNVCRVIVPGMRHFWRRLGPGRLYDVPVQIGLLDQRLREDQMNPYSVFI